MERLRELRRKAEQLRRVASVPTQGGAVEDRILIELAERLDQEAAVREAQLAATAQK